MNQLPEFLLYKWGESQHGSITANLYGSASPTLSLNDLIELSSDSKTTAEAFKFNDRPLAPAGTSPLLRSRIAACYEASAKPLSAENVLVTNGTTGAITVATQALLKPGDHVVVMHPTYPPLAAMAQATGAKLSFWRARPEQGWVPDLKDLENLVRPETKLIILNSPMNPTGAHLKEEVQKGILEIARKNNAVVFCDEIFHPLFHNPTTRTPSLVEHANDQYDRIIVAGSLSKCYGLSGVRIGWLVTPNTELIARLLHIRTYAVHFLGQIDEMIAEEVLSERCRGPILKQRHALSKHNLGLLDAFAKKHENRVRLVLPTAGAVAFIQFLDSKTGEAVNSMKFCTELRDKTGVVLSPGSPHFEVEGEDSFQGYARLHVCTKTETFEKGLEGIAKFLQ